MLNLHYHNNDYLQFAMFFGHLVLRMSFKLVVWLMTMAFSTATFGLTHMARFSWHVARFSWPIIVWLWVDRKNVALAVGLVAAGWGLLNLGVVIAIVTANIFVLGIVVIAVFLYKNSDKLTMQPVAPSGAVA